MNPHVAGQTSTGSKRPSQLFGPAWPADLPSTMLRAAGCRIEASDGRSYLDMIMALGAVAIGYADPGVTEAVVAAAAGGAVGSLSPELEEEVATRLAADLPDVDQVVFLKSGAEAMAAAVRIARVRTGRDRVLWCGYHGWLDWCQPPGTVGIPASMLELAAPIPFNDVEMACRSIRAAGPTLAAVVVEPVIHGAPNPDWLRALRDECSSLGSLLIFDEIKTCIRVGRGGAARRWGGQPDLIVVGKALANGYPLAAVAGPASIMNDVTRTWISSTLATEFVSLAAAKAVLERSAAVDIGSELEQRGRRWMEGIARLAERAPDVVVGVDGIPAMSAIRFVSEEAGADVARACARRGLLLKRSAYNFVSLAHSERDLEIALGVLGESVDAVRP